MTTHTLTTALWLPASRQEIFSFFADPFNLGAITPPGLRFSVVTPRPILMKTGALIDYRLRVQGFPLRWRSEITVWDPPNCFVDEQRRGLYRRWSHTHALEDKNGGTLCRDLVRYAVPGGRFINWLLVRRDLKKIFAHRQAALRRRFREDFDSLPPPAETASLSFATGARPRLDAEPVVR